MPSGFDMKEMKCNFQRTIAVGFSYEILYRIK
jgi:hypothetical protein